MVSAWSTPNAVVLGQVKTDEKSNEIVAIPKLLELLYLEGCIVTLDAMGCQKEVTALLEEAREESFETVPQGENDLHWVLDVAFDEDRSRVRKDNTPENLAMVRHVALNLVKPMP